MVPLAELEPETLSWCRQILSNSPTALRVLKAALNAAEDGQAGIQARQGWDRIGGQAGIQAQQGWDRIGGQAGIQA